MTRFEMEKRIQRLAREAEEATTRNDYVPAILRYNELINLEGILYKTADHSLVTATT